MAKGKAGSRPTRGLRTETGMQQAIEKVRNRKLSLSEASRTSDIPKATLFRHVADINKIAKGKKKHLGRFELTLDKTFEDELQEYVFDMEERLFGITNMDLRRLAFHLAERNDLNHNFGKTCC